jgi:hypothetical protein
MADAFLIEKTLKNLGYGEKWLGVGAIKALPSILWDDELPEKIIQGAYNGGFYTLVATNKRLIFVNKGLLSLKVEDFSYNKITTVEYSKGMFQGSMEIHASGNEAVVNQIKKDQVGPFAEYIRAKITKTPTNESSAVSLKADDPVKKLRQIKEMLDAGLIDQAEYDAKKKELLSRM